MPLRLFPRMGLPAVVGAPGAQTTVVRSIPASCLVLFGSTLAWATMMLLLGFNLETTLAILSTVTVAVSRLAGLTSRDPMDSSFISQLTQRRPE